MKGKLLLCMSLLWCIAALAQTSLIMVRPKGTGSWGYANLKGELVIPAIYDKCYPFSSVGLAVIYEGDQPYFINTEGKKITTEVTNFKVKGNAFSNGLIPVEVNNKCGYMNAAGKMAIQAKYDDATMFDHGYALVEAGGQFLVLDTLGQETIISDEDVRNVQPFSGKMARYRSAASKKMGFIGTNGKIAIPARFESEGDFVNGLAWAKIHGKAAGYIDSSGTWVLEPRFEVVGEFDAKSGLAKVRKNSRMMFVARDGETLEVTFADDFGIFSDGLAWGKRYGEFGFFDNTGVWVIKPQFDGMRDFHNGYAAAEKESLWGIIDRQGNWVIKPVFGGIKDVEVIW